MAVERYFDALIHLEYTFDMRQVRMVPEPLKEDRARLEYENLFKIEKEIGVIDTL